MSPLKRITPRRLIRWPRLLASSGKRRQPAMPAINQTGRLDDQAIREHLRDLGTDLRYWYRAAETKAQLVLTVNGLFITFLTTSVLARRADVVQATAAFGVETWVFLAGMSLCLALAILSAVRCLASRGVGRRKLRRVLSDYEVDPDKAETYAPELTVFFYYLSALKATPFTERLRTADQDFIVRALASDIIDFAPYIVAKHRWVNRAFILTGMTLGFFLCTGISYLIRVHLAALPPRPLRPGNRWSGRSRRPSRSRASARAYRYGNDHPTSNTPREWTADTSKTLSPAQTCSSGAQKMIKLKIMQQQAGHEHASTTALYTCVSSDFRTRTLRRALDATAAAATRPGRSA